MDDSDLILETGDGGAGAIVAALIVVVLIVLGAFYYFGTTHRGVTIDVNAPKIASGLTSAAP